MEFCLHRNFYHRSDHRYVVDGICCRYAVCTGVWNGINSFFCTIFVAGSFFAGEDVKTGYQAGLVIVFLSGIVFLLLSVTGLRKYIAVSMPECLKKAIPAGIGLFIAMIGFKNAGIIEDNQYTFVQFYDFHGRIKQIGYRG